MLVVPVVWAIAGKARPTTIAHAVKILFIIILLVIVECHACRKSAPPAPPFVRSPTAVSPARS